MSSPSTSTGCPCNSDRSYDDCCGPIHRGERKAQTAEQLMRSRYSAFVKTEIDFLGTSHDPETRDEFDAESAREWATRAKWKGFEILGTEGGGATDSTGTVEFIAHYAMEDTAIDHHEISEFRRVGEDWYFRDGKEISVPARRESPKVGRNEPCPCGSGKKYKKCCGK